MKIQQNKRFYTDRYLALNFFCLIKAKKFSYHKYPSFKDGLLPSMLSGKTDTIGLHSPHEALTGGSGQSMPGLAYYQPEHPGSTGIFEVQVCHLYTNICSVNETSLNCIKML
ncbi:hypothetical protein G5I_11974 [Acromyrmex echinatior]|uniref:Uncharacterized protein n=1 Tax=Acromyrmex echinatior TaxID=103372 RepID=F4X117_ACREC|nr:hypothetical protein G5I_11974 [Acromyrmex echinatior]